MIRPIQLRLVLLVCASATLVFGCAKQAAPASDSANGAVARMDTAPPPAGASSSVAAANAAIPPVIDSIGTYGEDLYDEVMAGNWAKAKALTDKLASTEANLPQANAASSNDFRALVDSLKTSVGGKHKAAALEQANQITRIAAEMTRPYTSATPVEVLLLDYQGRELEIWSAAKNVAKLQETTREIRTTWDALRPRI